MADIGRYFRVFFSNSTPETHGTSSTYLMEILLGDATVFNVKNAVEGLHIEQVHLLQVFQSERDTAQLLPYQWGQVKVQRLLGANSNPH